MPRPITPAQIRGARGMLNWTMLDLARAADVSVTTVKRMETVGREPVSDELRDFVRTALERAGVVFTAGDGWAGAKVRTGPA